MRDVCAQTVAALSSFRTAALQRAFEAAERRLLAELRRSQPPQNHLSVASGV